MISRIVDSWTGWPTWAKWASGIAAVVVAQAAITASGERDFLTGFIENIAAIVLRYGVVVGGIALAIWLGIKIAKRTRPSIGWVAGIIIVLVVLRLGSDITRSIPGVGWRVDAMKNDPCHVDWDGRSNPTVCD